MGGGARLGHCSLPGGLSTAPRSCKAGRPLPIWSRTAALSLRKMKLPPAEKAWAERLSHFELPWPLIWRIRSFYASPRDQLTWLKVMHSNLSVASTRSDVTDPTCRACEEKETMLHIVQCPIIRHEFWTPLVKLMNTLGNALDSQHQHRTKLTPSWC